MGALRAAAVLGAWAIVVAGCGSQTEGPRDKVPVAATVATPPAATKPPAVAAPAPPKPTATKRPIADDAEAADSFATDPSVKLTETAPRPGAVAKVAESTTEAELVSPGAPTDAEIARELKQMDAAVAEQGGGGTGSAGTKLKADGTASASAGMPGVVKRVIAGANAIAKYPYVYGGGHGSFTDTAYDCSGSLSYALAAGGLLDAPKTSGDLARTGKKGPGKWITIYANAGHTFMVVGGLRFDTSGRGGPLGTRWNASPRSTSGFRVTHPPGL